MRFGGVYIIMIFSLAANVFADQVPDAERWKFLRTITPEGYVCYRTSGPITIDGRMDEPAWNDAPWTNSFVDLQGSLNPLPRFDTRVKMLWDDEYFYVSALLEEPHVWGTLVFHDQVICIENDFEIFIDPNSDSHEYYEIELGPLNTIWDLYLNTGYKDIGHTPTQALPDCVWNINGMKTAVWVDGTINDPRDIDKGWSVEFAIPWSELAQTAYRPSPPLNGDTWRMNFYRAEFNHEITTSRDASSGVKNNAYKIKSNVPDQWVWTPQGTNSIHVPEMWGYVQFSTAATGTDEYRPDPLLEGRRVLHDIYYGQRDFLVQNKRWAKSLEELGLDYTGNTGLAGDPVIEITSDGYLAHIIATLPGGKTQKMSIRQDARVIVDDK